VETKQFKKIKNKANYARITQHSCFLNDDKNGLKCKKNWYFLLGSKRKRYIEVMV